jgi:hypothetical protein
MVLKNLYANGKIARIQVGVKGISAHVYAPPMEVPF